MLKGLSDYARGSRKNGMPLYKDGTRFQPVGDFKPEDELDVAALLNNVDEYLNSKSTEGDNFPTFSDSIREAIENIASSNYGFMQRHPRFGRYNSPKDTEIAINDVINTAAKFIREAPLYDIYRAWEKQKQVAHNRNYPTGNIAYTIDAVLGNDPKFKEAILSNPQFAKLAGTFATPALTNRTDLGIYRWLQKLYSDGKTFDPAIIPDADKDFIKKLIMGAFGATDSNKDGLKDYDLDSVLKGKGRPDFTLKIGLDQAPITTLSAQKKMYELAHPQFDAKKIAPYQQDIRNFFAYDLEPTFAADEEHPRISDNLEEAEELYNKNFKHQEDIPFKHAWYAYSHPEIFESDPDNSDAVRNETPKERTYDFTESISSMMQKRIRKTYN